MNFRFCTNDHVLGLFNTSTIDNIKYDVIKTNVEVCMCIYCLNLFLDIIDYIYTVVTENSKYIYIYYENKAYKCIINIKTKSHTFDEIKLHQNLITIIYNYILGIYSHFSILQIDFQITSC